MSLIPSSDSTPELRSIHQEFVLNALWTFSELMPPERIKYCSFSCKSLSQFQSKDYPVPP
jgi:hypothetical protein